MDATERVVRRFMERVEHGDFHAAFDLLATDGTYTVIGTTPVSRTYHGKRDFFENLVPTLATFLDGPVLRFREPIIAGDRAAVMASGSGTGPTGPYEQPYYAFVMRVHGEEFAEVYEFMDTAMLETAVFGRRPG